MEVVCLILFLLLSSQHILSFLLKTFFLLSNHRTFISIRISCYYGFHMQVIPVLAILHSTFFFFIVINVYDTVTLMYVISRFMRAHWPLKKFETNWTLILLIVRSRWSVKILYYCMLYTSLVYEFISSLLT